jgi:hypothetical protein
MFPKNGLVTDGQSLSLEGISGLAFAKWRLGLEGHVLDVNYRPACRSPGGQQLGDPLLRIGIVSGSQARTIEALLNVDEKQGGAGRQFCVHALAFLFRISAMRDSTSRFTKADGIGLVSGNRIVPFDVSYLLSSFAWARLIATVIG